MKNDTRKDTAELDFNDLEMVSGGSGFDPMRDAVETGTKLVKKVYDWIFH